MDLEYYASELFIHDDLVKQAEVGLSTLHKTWKRVGRIDPFVLSWVQEPITCDDGKMVDGFFLSQLPEDRSKWSDRLVRIVRSTKPYGLLVCEQRDDEVVAIFETQHGSRSWRYPIKMHGRSAVLGEPTMRDNTDSVGILWRAKRAEA